MTKQQNLNDQASFSAPIEDLQVRIAFLDDLVEQGLMTKRDYPPGCGDNSQIYYMTKEGFKFLSDLTGMEITEMD